MSGISQKMRRLKDHIPELCLAVFSVISIYFFWTIWSQRLESRLAECKGRVEECRKEDQKARDKIPYRHRMVLPRTNYPVE
jgi:hypothetical protein